MGLRDSKIVRQKHCPAVIRRSARRLDSYGRFFVPLIPTVCFWFGLMAASALSEGDETIAQVAVDSGFWICVGLAALGWLTGGVSRSEAVDVLICFVWSIGAYLMTAAVLLLGGIAVAVVGTVLEIGGGLFTVVAIAVVPGTLYLWWRGAKRWTRVARVWGQRKDMVSKAVRNMSQKIEGLT